MTIAVGKANVTENIANVLAVWQKGNNEQLLAHIDTISNVQDILCRIITEELSEKSRATIGTLLGDIVCVKDDLKLFIANTGEQGSVCGTDSLAIKE